VPGFQDTTPSTSSFGLRLQACYPPVGSGLEAPQPAKLSSFGGNSLENLKTFEAILFIEKNRIIIDRILSTPVFSSN